MVWEDQEWGGARGEVLRGVDEPGGARSTLRLRLKRDPKNIGMKSHRGANEALNIENSLSAIKFERRANNNSAVGARIPALPRGGRRYRYNGIAFRQGGRLWLED